MTNKPDLMHIREWVINTKDLVEMEYSRTPVLAKHHTTLKDIRFNLNGIASALKLHIDEIIEKNVKKPACMENDLELIKFLKTRKKGTKNEP